MRILIINSNNSGHIAPFITDQVETLQKAGITCEYFSVEGKGIVGYLRNYVPMLRKIRAYRPHIIHAHYGLSGLLANLQRRIPVVTTYHGSDINNPKVLRFSKIAIKLSAWNIFVSQKNIDLAGIKSRYSLIPCGVDKALFRPKDKEEARKSLGFDKTEKLILFAGAFDNKVKNPELAIEAVKRVPNARLLELKGYTRPQVAQLMNAVDVCLMTSHTEGSPQFIKEAMACNCSVVSVPVGDVPDVINGIEGCDICSYEPSDVAKKLKQTLEYGKRTEGRKRIIELGLDSENVSKRILEIYKYFNRNGF